MQPTCSRTFHQHSFSVRKRHNWKVIGSLFLCMLRHGAVVRDSRRPQDSFWAKNDGIRLHTEAQHEDQIIGEHASEYEGVMFCFTAMRSFGSLLDKTSLNLAWND